MQQIFTSTGKSSREGFERWRELLNAQLLPIEVERISDEPFQAEFEVATIGPLQLSRLSQSALRCAATSAANRSYNNDDMVAVILRERGRSTSVQDDREAVQRAGDLLILDRRPSAMTTGTDSQALFVEVPRERLESTLGVGRRYAGLTVGANRASTTLATSFIQQLTQLGPQLGPASAARMASIAVDLIAASLAERLAQDVPRPLHGTVAVQQAKAHIEANIGDPSLDPPHLAAAIGLSLRRLQELFQERGKNISDYIWQRRLATAAKRLVDPACAHLSLGAIALSCGFADAGHFSRRFKALHGMTPSEYRATLLVQTR